jgi:chemosensory pili system protein ChpC
VLTQGFPRLTTLNAELIIPTHDGSPLPAGVRAQVLVRDDVAMIPDLEWIEPNCWVCSIDADLTERRWSRTRIVRVTESADTQD